MPFIEAQTLPKGYQLGSWSIEERLADLEAQYESWTTLPKVYHQLQAHERRRQWLAARLLIAEMLQSCPSALQRDVWGRPYYQGLHCSISHATGKAIAVVGHAPCGVDLEYPQARLRTLAHKFLHTEELAAFDVQSISLQELTMLWGAKEAMYKLYGKRGLSLRQHYRIMHFEWSANPKHAMLTGRIETDHGNTLELDVQCALNETAVLALVVEKQLGPSFLNGTDQLRLERRAIPSK